MNRALTAAAHPMAGPAPGPGERRLRGELHPLSSSTRVP